jgi:hypothetical protein
MPPAVEAPKLEVKDHLDKCPKNRIERFEAVRPKNYRVVIVTRCLDCGGQDVTKTNEFRRPDTDDDDKEADA